MRTIAPHFPRTFRLIAWAVAVCAGAAESGAATFANGADIGWVSQFERMGVKWRNSAGVQQDVLRCLGEQGINAVRLRVFVNPPADAMSGGYPIGFCDPASVVAMAVRARQAGLTRIMVDFHYSDVFADPGKQTKPAAWSADSFTQLADHVYQHTYDVMSALAAAGMVPQWVQVGNEINGGLLWPDGGTSNFKQLTQLLNRGYDAVKAVSPSSKVIIHLANGYDNAAFRWWFDAFAANGGKWDVIGMSYYPSWAKVDYTQNIAALGANLADMASRYGREVMVCEVGGPESAPANTYDMVAATVAAVKAVPAGSGLGVFYWEPESNQSVSGYALGATTRVAANDLQFTKVISAFATPKPLQVTVPPSDGANALVNLSTRGVVEPGENALIGGFAIVGSGSKRVLIRATANTLLRYGVDGVLRMPLLTLYDANRAVIRTAGVLDTYVNAQGAPVRSPVYLSPPDFVQVRPDLVQVARAAGAFDFGLPAWATEPSLSGGSGRAQGDCALVADLPPGLFSVVITPDSATPAFGSDPAISPFHTSAASGLALLEIYDLSSDGAARLTNLSSRGKIDTGDRQLIVGFVVGGTGHRRVLVRGIGPALGQFGVAGAVDDVALTLFDSSGATIVANDDWGDAAVSDQVAALSGIVGAFSLRPSSLDSAVVTRLTPALYSAVVTSVTGRPGVGLAEIYECP